LDAAIERSKRTRLNRLLVNPVRSLVPVAARKAGFQRVINCPTFWGGTFTGVVPEDVSTLIWRQTFFDHTVCRSMLSVLKSGDGFIDVGAHFGFFSLLAAKLVGKSGFVESVEAMPSTFERLNHNISANAEGGSISLHNVAAHEEESELAFRDFGLLNSSLNSHKSPRNPRLGRTTDYPEIPVKGIPLDSIIDATRQAKIAAVKIDAESSELQVLRGMSDIIKQSKPVLIIEISGMDEQTSAQSSAIIDHLAPSGYRPYKWVDGDLQPADTLPATYDNYMFKV
ncbi:MAG: FkbM family methyltransferase, partial [Pseudomonadota bacterium]